MAKAPDFIAFVVQDPKHDDGQAVWREIGAVWRHGKGEGFDLVIHDQLSVAGRVVCMPRKERDADRPAPAQTRGSRPEPTGRR